MGDGMSDGAICGWRDGHTCHLPVGHGGPCDNDRCTCKGSALPGGDHLIGCPVRDDAVRSRANDSSPVNDGINRSTTCPRCGAARWFAFSGATHYPDDCREIAALRAKYETLLDNTRSRDKTIVALRDELEVVHEHNTKLVGENHVLRAERDVMEARWRNQCEEATGLREDYEALRAEIKKVKHERDVYDSTGREWLAEVERMRPMVEAIENLSDFDCTCFKMGEGECGVCRVRDAYRASEQEAADE